MGSPIHANGSAVERLSDASANPPPTEGKQPHREGRNRRRSDRSRRTVLVSLAAKRVCTMIRLYYLSQVADGIDDEDYQRILETSQRNNLVSGVTGLLIIKRGFFAQALEGEREFVDPLFQKIRWDPRHSNVEILSREEGVDTRIFPTWAIGYRNLNICDAPPKVGDVDMVEFLRNADPYQLGVFFRAFPEDSLAEAM